MRILLSAFAISPTKGSEPGLGWQLVSRLAKMHDVTVLYGDLNGSGRVKTEHEEWLREHREAPRMTLAYVAPSRIAIFCASGFTQYLDCSPSTIGGINYGRRGR